MDLQAAGIHPPHPAGGRCAPWEGGGGSSAPTTPQRAGSSPGRDPHGGKPTFPSRSPDSLLSSSFRSVYTAQRRGGASPETRPPPGTQLTPGVGAPRRLLEELGHVQAGNRDIPEDGHVVWTRLGRALLQRLDDGLLHVPAGVPPHGQQRADVVVPGRVGGIRVQPRPPSLRSRLKPPGPRLGGRVPGGSRRLGGSRHRGAPSLPPHAGGARLRSSAPPRRGTESASSNQSARPPSHRRPERQVWPGDAREP